MLNTNNKEEDELPKPDSNVPYEIVLPCDPDQFGEFVSGLLGKPQTIEKSIHGVFEIEHEDVINTFLLVDQRIHQQNDASLIQFTVKILYDDDSSILLNSLADFQQYTEVRPITSIGVMLSWVYLIKFKNKRAPEKQEINVSFRSNGSGPVSIVMEDGFIVSRSPRWHGPRGIFIRINHTERTWGVDIESLLTGHVKTLIKDPEKKEKFITKHSGTIGLSTGIMFFLSAIAGVLVASSHFIDSYLIKVRALVSEAENNTAVVSSKLDFLIEIISTGAWPRFIFSTVVFLIISLILSIFLGTWVGSNADNRSASYVLLSKAAKENRKKCMDKLQRDWAMFSLSIVVSIVTGIVSNIIFTKYFSDIAIISSTSLQ